jgi:hypothetical protein
MSFDADESLKLAESYAHRGLLPPEMSSRWDAQGAFIAGQRLMHEQLQKKISTLTIELDRADRALNAVAMNAIKCEQVEEWLIAKFEMDLVQEALLETK